MAGRGGAGNIEAANAKINQTIVKSQDKAELGGVDESPIAQKYAKEKDQERSTQDYAHMGRGGAGNYYSPRELHSQGEFNSTSAGDAIPTVDSERPLAATDDGSGKTIPNPQVKKNEVYPEAPGSTGAHSGRGGAGNFVGSNAPASPEQNTRLREAIDRDLEKGMPQEPGKAYLGGRSRGESSSSTGVDGP